MPLNNLMLIFKWPFIQVRTFKCISTCNHYNASKNIILYQKRFFNAYFSSVLNNNNATYIATRKCSHYNVSQYSKRTDCTNLPEISIETVPPEVKISKNGTFIIKGHSFMDVEESKLHKLYENFNLHKLKLSSLEKFNAKISNDLNSLCFPMEDSIGNVTAVQLLTYDSTSNKVMKRIFPKELTASVFGWSTISQTSNDIVITSNCVDAIAVNQELGISAVAVNFDNEKFPAQVLKFFEKFSKIFLWFLNQQHHWSVHKLFVERYGKKTYLVKPSSNPSTPLYCLQNSCNLKQFLNCAIPLKHEFIETFASFKDETFAEFNEYEKYSGAKWKRFPVLNELLKGLRKGELTVFSGQTGTGKTTFMSEYSLDLCIQGVPTLWGSFEVTNTRLIKTMLTQFSLCSLKEEAEKFHYWATEFDKLPMFFMNFNGHHSIKHIIEAMTHTVVVYSIEHIVIDNLQFMMNIEDFNSNIDQLRRQDQIFAVFRNFACQHNCHITLVMHPRKEPEFTELNNNSISGSAKATQEADNILLLQTTKNKQYLQVTKNRFDGEKGCVLLEFHKNTLTFTIKKITSKVFFKNDT